ncbi:MAG: HAD-IIB family hydrolase [Bacteroidales bacterium]|nr:HAD-IIB family hydrolase [Bacteroidales bacterium]
MNLKSVIIDLDGTLLNDKRKVGDNDFKTLQNLGKQNVERIIATGRSLFSTNEVLASDFPIDYLIFAAGAGIMNYKTKKIIKSHFITKNDVITIAKRLDKLKIDFQVRANIPNSHKYFFKRFSETNPDFDRINLIYKSYIKELNDFKKLENSARFICIAQDNKIVKQIENEFKEFSIIRATSPIDNRSVWMEIYPKGVNKGTAVKFLVNKLNLDLSDTIAVGNDYNDIHFLDCSGISFVVNNAPGNLKEKYNITVSNNDNPLTTIINSFK